MTKAKSKIKTVLGIIWWALLIFLVFLIGKTLISKANNQVPSFLGYSIVYILSGSMETTIPANSYILIKKCSPQDVEVEQVICFYSDDPQIMGVPNTHRVKEIIQTGNGLEFVTRGDNNIADDKVNAKGESLIGVYVCNLTLLTSIIGGLQGNGFIIFLIAIQVISCCVAVYVFIKNKNQKIEGENE